MNWREHIWFSTMMNPKFDPKTVQKVNRAIDEPSMMNAFLKSQQSKRFIIPGLNITGHRKFNHDLLSAMMAGFQVAGYEGAKAAYYHLMADTLSNNMARGLKSSDMRDSFLSMMMHTWKVPHYDMNPK